MSALRSRVHCKLYQIADCRLPTAIANIVSVANGGCSNGIQPCNRAIGSWNDPSENIHNASRESGAPPFPFYCRTIRTRWSPQPGAANNGCKFLIALRAFGCGERLIGFCLGASLFFPTTDCFKYCGQVRAKWPMFCRPVQVSDTWKKRVAPPRSERPPQR